MNKFQKATSLIEKYYNFNSDAFIRKMLSENRIPTANLSQHQVNSYKNKMNLSSPNYANRDGDIHYASIGALTELHYPTGGHTKFEYEAHKRKENIIGRKSLFVFQNKINNDDQLINIATIGDISGSDTNNNVIETQQINVKFSLSFEPSGVNDDIRKLGFIKLKVTNHTLNEVEYATMNEDLEMLNLCCFNDVYGNIIEFPFTLIKNHAYSFELQLSTRNVGGSYVSVNAWFDYVKGYDYKDDLGIRIKRVTDYTNENSVPNNIKRFYYKKAEKISTPEETPFEVYSVPKYLRFQRNYYRINKLGEGLNNGTFQTIPYYVSIFSSGSFQSLLPSSDSNSLYTNVTISYGGDSFEEGGVEKKFKISRSKSIGTYHTSPVDYQIEHIKLAHHNNQNIFNGLLLSNIYMKRNESNFIAKIKKEDYSYNILNYGKIPYLYGEQLPKDTGKGYHYDAWETYTLTNANPVNVDDLYIGGYSNYAFKQELVKQVTTEYIEPLLLGADEGSVEKLITTVNYEYGNLTGLPIKTTTTKSEGEVLKTVNTYPTNGTLFNQHRISTPVNVRNYEGSLQLSEQNTVYTNFGNLYLPSKVQTSKGGQNLEDRVVYHSYDDKGNPTEVSKANGTHIVYIWGYEQTQPIAKIENAKLSDISEATITNLQTLSNQDNDRTIGNLGKEGALRTALNTLRTSLPNAQVTTFTYDPLVGVTSITDPRRQTIYYEYDEFNRLKFIKDTDGNLLKEHKYKYKN